MITDTTAVVTWQTDEPSTSVVSYGEGPGLGNTASNPGYSRDHSVLLTGLIAATLHSVEVSTTDETGNGPTYFDVVTFTTLFTPDVTTPVILQGPIITEITHSSAVVEWITDEMTTALVSYGTDLSNTIDVTEFSTNHKVTIPNLSASTEYSVQINATDKEDNGPTQSVVVSFMTLETPDATAPNIISGPMVVDITDDAATIVWETDEPAVSGVSYNDGIAHGLVRDESLSTEHKVRLTNLSALAQYFFTVSSTDSLGNGPTLSNESTFTTLNSPDIEPPLFIDDIKIVGITHQSALIHWNTDEPSSGIIWYGTSDTDLTLSAAVSKLKNKQQLQLTGLSEDTTYYFKIVSRDAYNSEYSSSIMSFVTHNLPDTAAPAFIESPYVEKATDTSVILGWETDEPTEYQIKYGKDGNINQQKASGEKKSKHQVILSGLDDNATYNFDVIVTDLSGNQKTTSSTETASVLSFAVMTASNSTGNTFTTSDTADTTAPIISNLTAVDIQSNYAVVNWDTDEIADSQVAFSISDSNETKVTGDLEFTSSHSIVLTKLEPSTTYEITVKSTDVAKNGSSAILTFTTLVSNQDPEGDFDGDGIANDLDKDDDNDGLLDEDEKINGSDPFDPSDPCASIGYHVVNPQFSILPSSDTDRVVFFDASQTDCYEMAVGCVKESRVCNDDWDFGGIGNIVGGNGDDIIVYQYDAPGDYTASLSMAEQISGETATDNLTVTAEIVQTPLPAIDFITEVNLANVSLTIEDLDPTDSDVIESVIVFWGDRYRDEYNLPATINHTYTRTGTHYCIRVKVMLDDGAQFNYTFMADEDLTVSIP